MPALRAGRLLIPGGWFARVPEALHWCPQTMRAYTAYWLEDHAGDAWAAREHSLQVLQQMVAQTYLQELKKNIKRWARLYAKRWPKAVQADGTLRGFQPEVMQGAFMPGGTNMRRKGLAFAHAMMEGMAKGAGL